METVARRKTPAGPIPRVLFLGSTYAGHSTRFATLESAMSADSRLDADFRRVSGWKPGGAFERLPVLPRGLKGRLRAVREAAPFARFPRPDVIWTSATEALTPYLCAQVGPWRRPVVLDLDATWRQLDSMSEFYKGRAPKAGVQLALQQRLHSRILATVSLFTPWSTWAADGLRALGIDESLIRVMPPGVDLQRWKPIPRSLTTGRPLRLLFIGGDFVRKGGDLLLDAMRSPLGEQFELDIVTRGPVEETRNTRVHRLEHGDARLMALYGRADLFVMPSKAECFGIATTEAMATGLPVLVSDVGGARDIVADGHTGWLIEPAAADVRGGLCRALQVRSVLPVMGAAARARVEAKFDSSRLLDQLTEEIHALASRRTAAQPPSDHTPPE